MAPVVDSALSLRRYLHHLLVPWKLIGFAGATALVTLAAPYGHDRTWDTTDSLLISALVFAVGPWSVATFYRDVVGRRVPAAHPDRLPGLLGPLLVLRPIHPLARQWRAPSPPCRTWRSAARSPC